MSRTSEAAPPDGSPNGAEEHAGEAELKSNIAHGRDLSLAVFDDDDLQAELIVAGSFVKHGAAARKHAPTVEAENFRHPGLRAVMSAALAVVERGEIGVDDRHYFVELVQQELDSNGTLRAVGGPGTVMDLWLHQSASVPELVAYWAAKVIKAHQRRADILALAQAQQSTSAGDERGDVWRSLREHFDGGA